MVPHTSTRAHDHTMAEKSSWMPIRGHQHRNKEETAYEDQVELEFKALEHLLSSSSSSSPSSPPTPSSPFISGAPGTYDLVPKPQQHLQTQLQKEYSLAKHYATSFDSHAFLKCIDDVYDLVPDMKALDAMVAGYGGMEEIVPCDDVMWMKMNGNKGQKRVRSDEEQEQEQERAQELGREQVVPKTKKNKLAENTPTINLDEQSWCTVSL